MSVLVEVLVGSVDDARAAADGGAHRLELVGAPEHGGMSPEPRLVADVCAAVSIPVRARVRLRDGFGTDGGEATRMSGLITTYLAEGAEGMVLGFLNGHGEVDVHVCGRLIADGDWPWTFHRAIDAVLAPDAAWATLRQLPRLDAVCTAGSARGVDHGLDQLLAWARDDTIRPKILACGGLTIEHLPWLVRGGITRFQVGSAVREGHHPRGAVQADVVHAWCNTAESLVERTGEE